VVAVGHEESETEGGTIADLLDDAYSGIRPLGLQQELNDTYRRWICPSTRRQRPGSPKAWCGELHEP
jgi:hypothetical protein